MRRMFSQLDPSGVQRVSFPCHIVSRSYTVLADAAALAQRYAVAEQYYCLAIKACEAAGSGSDAHPYALLLLDRLMGAVMSQGRNEHATPLVHLFQTLWNKFTCPSKLSLPLPLTLVFGKAIPNAFVLAYEQISSNAGFVSGFALCLTTPIAVSCNFGCEPPRMFDKSMRSRAVYEESKNGIVAWVTSILDFTSYGIDVIVTPSLLEPAAESAVEPYQVPSFHICFRGWFCRMFGMCVSWIRG